MNILVVSGGSGGHIYPSLSLIKELNNYNVIYLGTNSKLEKKIIPSLKIKYYLLNNKGLKKGLLNKIIFIYYLIINFFKIIKIIKKENINKIITFGGYSSSSVFLANLLFKKEIYIHEQNAIIGRNNKLMLRFSNKIFTSFIDTIGIKNKYKHKVIYTGNPRFFINKKKKDKFKILIMTGSLGSKTVTNKLLPLLDIYNDITLISGINNDFKHKKIVNYVDNMEEFLSEFSLIITRSGATSLNEISSLGIPSILIPSPYVINNHQYINALSYLKIKRGYLIKEEDLNIDEIINIINELKVNKFLYEELKNNTLSFYNKNAIKLIKEEMKL